MNTAYDLAYAATGNPITAGFAAAGGGIAVIAGQGIRVLLKKPLVCTQIEKNWPIRAQQIDKTNSRWCKQQVVWNTSSST